MSNVPSTAVVESRLAAGGAFAASERDGAAHYCRRAGGLGRQTVGEKELKHSHAGLVRRITSIREKQRGMAEKRRGPSR
jgi:hypothetical protein